MHLRRAQLERLVDDEPLGHLEPGMQKRDAETSAGRSGVRQRAVPARVSRFMTNPTLPDAALRNTAPIERGRTFLMHGQASPAMAPLSGQRVNAPGYDHAGTPDWDSTDSFRTRIERIPTRARGPASRVRRAPRREAASVARRRPVALLPEPAHAIPLPAGGYPDPAGRRVGAPDPDSGAAAPAPVSGSPATRADDRGEVPGPHTAETGTHVAVVAPP